MDHLKKRIISKKKKKNQKPKMIKLYIYKKIEITSIKKIPYLTEIFTSPD